MKKVLSIVLSILMVFSFVSFVYTEELIPKWSDKNELSYWEDPSHYHRVNQSSFCIDSDILLIREWNKGGSIAYKWLWTINMTDFKTLFHWVIIEQGISSIPSDAFVLPGSFFRAELNGIWIPSSVKQISSGAIQLAHYVFILSRDVIIENNAIGKWSLGTTIFGYEGSTAQEYAESNNIDFVPLCEQHSCETVILAEPTCTEAGKQDDKICKECGYIAELKHPLDPLGHDYVLENYKAGNCIEEGYSGDLICSRCGDVESYGHITGQGDHVFSDWQTITEATCTSDGSALRICEKCGEKETKTVPALSHNYIAAITPATCTSDGFTVFECSRCHDKYTTDIVPAAGHSYAAIVTPATCTTNGFTVYECSFCHDQYTDDITPAIGHNYVSSLTPPTCTSEGFTTYECSRCHDKYVDNIVSSTGHTFTTSVIAPTCIDKGYSIKTCVICKETEKTDWVDALDHDYSVTVISPTCTEKGYTIRKCNRCGYSFTSDETDLTSHVETDIPEIPATCTESGLSEGKKCAVCGIVLVNQKEIPALGHSFHSVTESPQKNQEGFTADICIRCGLTKNKKIWAYAINFTPSTISLNKNEKYIPVYSLTPIGSSDALKWKSDSPKIVTVEAKTGEITAIAAGTAIITATTDMGISASFRVSVLVPSTDIKSTEENVVVPVNGSKQLHVELIPADSTDNIFWKSNNNNVATVSPDGIVTGVAKGSATITAESKSGARTTIRITVVQLAETITLDKTELSFSIPGGIMQLTAVVSPEDAENKQIIWKSSDPRVAEVNETGKITTLSIGTAVITATVKDTGISAVCHVYVSSVLPGDIDFDGNQTAADARLALRIAVGLEVFDHNSKQFLAANVDDDNSITAADARLILRAAVELETLTKEPHYHVFGPGTRVDPLCDKTGYETATCRICGNENKVVIPALGHNWIHKDGVKGRVCSLCGITECEFNGHSFIEKITVPATCTTMGYKTVTCSVCGYSDTESIPKTDHKWILATCTSARKCSVCGKEEGVPLGHSWDSGVMTQEATCIQKGIKTYTCTVCNTTKTETFPFGAHILKKVARVEPTTEKEGNIEYYHCSVCNSNFSDRDGQNPVVYVIIPKLNNLVKLESSEIFKVAKQYTVEINTIKKGNSGIGTGTGTGFFISNDGVIVTNYHVIDMALTITVTDCTEKNYSVNKILAYDQTMDIAILKIDAVSTAAILNKTNYETGDRIYTLGSSNRLTYTFSDGLISTKSRRFENYNPTMYYIQLSAPLSPGNSGGPLIDEYGRVIGINTWTNNNGQNLNFAIPVYYLDQLDYSHPVTITGSHDAIS